jgi:transposase InsO family protein
MIQAMSTARFTVTKPCSHPSEQPTLRSKASMVGRVSARCCWPEALARPEPVRLLLHRQATKDLSAHTFILPTESELHLQVAPDVAQRHFYPAPPNRHCSCDTVCTPRNEGQRHQVAAFDRHGGQAACTCMLPLLQTKRVQDALLMPHLRRRQAKARAGQCYLGSHGCHAQMKARGIDSSMSHEGNCSDNPATGSFWRLE